MICMEKKIDWFWKWNIWFDPVDTYGYVWKRSLTSMYEEIDGIFINEFLENYLWKDNVDRKLNIYKDIKDKLYDDLNRLIKALEIYLYQYVNKINCEKNYQIYKK